LSVLFGTIDSLVHKVLIRKGDNVSETTLDRLISKGLVDAYACHKACGEYWTQCECYEVWVESQGGLEALMQEEESAKREYLDNSCQWCDSTAPLADVEDWFYSNNPDEDARRTCVDCVTMGLDGS